MNESPPNRLYPFHRIRHVIVDRETKTKEKKYKKKLAKYNQLQDNFICYIVNKSMIKRLLPLIKPSLIVVHYTSQCETESAKKKKKKSMLFVSLCLMITFETWPNFGY